MEMDLKQAILNAGGYSAVARKMTELNNDEENKITKQVIWSWVNVLHRVPAEKVMELETVTGIPRQLIRPDIYPSSREDQDVLLAYLASQEEKENASLAES